MAKPIRAEIHKEREPLDPIEVFMTMGLAIPIHLLLSEERYRARVEWDDGTVTEGYGDSEAEARERAMER